jgi:hypothetical protein
MPVLRENFEIDCAVALAFILTQPNCSEKHNQ